MNKLEKIRRDSLQSLRELGIDPYPAAAVPLSHTSAEILSGFDPQDPQAPHAFASVSLAGRIMSRRIMGKASFVELMDGAGRIQVYIARDELCPQDDKDHYNHVFKKYLDIGDFIGVTGSVFQTKTGETSLRCQTLTVLSKALAPLPIVKVDAQGVSHDSFSDTEARYRNRSVDLLVNAHVKGIFVKRAAILRTIRQYFDQRGYLEVETPVLQAVSGGAVARPFITHHNTLDIPLYLRIANELYLKRLIIGGFDAVYEFAKDFRNEGMDKTHNPEFTQVELYVAYKDYLWMMDFTERMIEHLCVAVNGSHQVHYQGETLSFKAPFQRVSILDAIRDHTGYDVSDMDEKGLTEVCQNLGIDTQQVVGKGKLLDKIFGEQCEGKYIAPTFITDYPKCMSPLSKTHRSDPQLTERFELIVNGKEIANAYSELNDPIDQRERFEEQIRLHHRGDEEAMNIDHDFLSAMEYGMPPMSGIGIGIDRLTMLFTDQRSIQEVILFPQMRPVKS